MTIRKARIFTILAGAALLTAPLQAQFQLSYDGQFQPDPAHQPTLAEQLGAIANTENGRLGIAATDLDTGETITFAGRDPFPMASTVKIAIAGAYLAGVDSGRFNLDQLYRYGRRSTVTANVLLQAMLIRSDNAAADTLLMAIGGTRPLGAWLEKANISGQRVDRSIAELLRDHETKKRIRVGKGKRRHWITVSVPRAAPVGDKRDSSTPEAMVALLAKLRNGELLDAPRTAYLFDVMARCRTGPGRIRGLLPSGTPVAHKTGTMNGITDDVGIVSLPNGHDLAVAIFETGSGGARAHDRKIAQLSRILYDHFNSTS